MAARFFTKSGAVELVVHIMSLCETPSDLKALAATCVRTRDVWLANKATIMWQVWPQSDLALIAVRATKLVQDAEDRGVLPPKDLNLPQLSGSVILPSIPELESMSRLQALVDKLEVAFCLDTWELKKVSTTPRVYEKCPRLRDNVRKAVFRVFITGAALAGAYTEPFLEAKRTGMTQVNNFAFLRDFILYNPYVKSEAKVAEFEHLAIWLVDDILSDHESRQLLETKIRECGGMGNKCSPTRPCASVSPGNDDCISRHLIECNIMQMLWVYRHMWKTMNPGADRYDWRTSKQLTIQRQAQLQAAANSQDNPDRVSIVLFGRFRVQNVVISGILSHRRTLGHLGSPAPYIIQNPATSIFNPKLHTEVTVDHSVLTLMSWVFRFTPRPSATGQYNRLPLDYAFFDYVLKQYAGVRMKPSDAYSMASPVQLLGAGTEIARFLWTFNDFLASDEQFKHRTPLRPPRYVNNCLLMEGFDEHGKPSRKCKHIGATVHLAATKCPHC